MDKVNNIKVIPTLSDEQLSGLVEDAIYLINEGVRKPDCRIRTAARELAEGQIGNVDEALKIVERQVFGEAAERFVAKVNASE